MCHLNITSEAYSSRDKRGRGVIQVTDPASTYLSFAEISLPPSVSPHERETGLLIRALLPIPSAESRASDQKFAGTAAVAFVRSICVKPQFNATMVLSQIIGTNRRTTVFSGRFSADLEM
jgi:hypothetical protein